MATTDGSKAATDNATTDTATTKDAVADTTLTALSERLRFFFSDANLRQDAFMRKYLMQDEHVVPVEVLLRFNTIKQHTESTAVVVQAARLIDSLVLSDDETKIGLVHPFTEAKMDDNIPLSLYVSNLPFTEKKYEVATDDVRKLFDNADHIVLVKLRFRHGDKVQEDLSDLQPSVAAAAAAEAASQPATGHKKKGRRVPIGAALVEFDSLEELQRAAAQTVTTGNDASVEHKPEKPLTIGESIVSVMLLRDYIDSCKSKSKPSEPAKRKVETEAKVDADPAPKKEDATPKSREFSVDWKPGCVIALKGITTAGTCDRESILSAVATAMDTTVEEMKSSKTVYVDFSRGQTEGALRFSEPSDAVAKLCAQLESGEVMVGGAKVESAVILNGEAETAYWNNFIAFKTKQMNQRSDERSSSRHKNKRTRRN